MTIQECLQDLTCNTYLLKGFSIAVNHYLEEQDYKSQYQAYEFILENYPELSPDFSVHIGINDLNLPGSISKKDLDSSDKWHICVNKNMTSLVLVSSALARSMINFISSKEKGKSWIGGYEYKKFLEDGSFQNDIFLYHTLNFNNKEETLNDK